MTVRDLWLKTDRKTRSTRWGVGKRWQVVYIDIDGHRVSKSFDTKEEATLFDANVKVHKADGTLIAKAKQDVTFNELWTPWLETKANISDKSRRDYVSIWKVHVQPVWGRRRVSDVQEHQVAAWVAGLSTMKGVPEGGQPRAVGTSAKHKAGVVLKSLLSLAVKLKVVPANPVDGRVTPSITQAERRYLRIDEVDALLGAAPNPAVRLLLETLLKTGLRPGEAKGLKVRDLDAERRRLMIRRDVDDLGRADETKTRQHRDVPLSAMMVQLLTEAAAGKHPNSWLLPDELGHVWTTARWRVVWNNLLVWTGIDASLKTYELRHTAVSMAIAGGADVYVVQRMVGHSSAATTLKYYGHLWDHGLDQAAEAIETHLEAERKRFEQGQARRAQKERDEGVRHLRVVR